MNDMMKEDSQIKCKNIVSMYTIRMYLNGVIIGYVFRREIYRKFYVYKNDNLLFHCLKKGFSSVARNKGPPNTAHLSPKSLSHHRKIRLASKLNYYGSRKGNKYVCNFFPFRNLSNLKKNMEVSNFLASRLAFWTCFCTLTCWELNTVFESSVISPIFSGLVASAFNKVIFREYQKILIPGWLGCILSYIIFI
ncbi:hypothetical protein, conserved [Plasmodium vivax]|uniref:Uncharacterized protein n=4 Tax=Plasmodium vivax TaxID=5855 RepID=A5K3W4_PLAVS|nr:hypothetical protein, conserved [Plasmodium vivax]EDL46218.1 hypothetical protein, conserved [Plasmodium vivax]KMZ91761.1 hypothetical protein PVMG_00634 [Plasmodium vivax Mauritania I]KMZ97785.1 hypothetical protein PVNG_03632 [Plasmodium vivax North Korean]SCO69003.1 conserved Plasmodium protein, unknown function [Plasmodium vivax]|eukprot:XP_001615945.1 hypothetical protein [Plasmodium vivax Sal-1]